MFGKVGRTLYNLASQATGLGITANIIDCYAALIRLYRDGDRIFLFGFSRGAYTVRCLAGVIAKCGIPRCMPNGTPLPLDIKGSRRLATYAVKNVYQFCSSRPRKEAGSYRNFMLDTCELIAARFRTEHGSGNMQEPHIPIPPDRNTTNARLGIGSDLCVVCLPISIRVSAKRRCTNRFTHASPQIRFFSTMFSPHIDPSIWRSTWISPTIGVKATRLCPPKAIADDIETKWEKQAIRQIG